MEEAGYSVFRAQRQKQCPGGSKKASWRRMPLSWALKKDSDQTRMKGRHSASQKGWAIHTGFK